MGLNRFSTVGQSEYTAQHVPLPFDTISKLGETIKLEHDTADAAASAAKTDIQGGLATQEHAKALNAKKNALLQAAQARAEQTNNYGRLTQDIKEIASTVQNDPLYQGIQRDIAMTKLVNQQRMDPNHPYVVQNYADEKGGVRQLGIDQPFDESYYNVVAPGNRNTERKPLFDQMKPIVSRIYEQPVTKTWEDENGKIHTQTLQEGVEAEGLRRAQVKKIMANYIRQDPNALNTQSYMYDKARLNKEGKDWTPEDELEASANAFMGEFYNEKDLQKLGADKVTGESAAAAKARAKAAGGGNDDGEVPNQFVLLADAKNTQATTPVLKDLGYAEGPKEVPGSYMVTLDGSDGQAAIVNFAKVTADNPQANNIVNYGTELNNLSKKLGYTDNETFIEKLRGMDPKSDYQIVGNEVIINSPVTVNGKTTRSRKSVPIQTLKESVLKTTDEYKILEDEAKENGVNISDPKFRDNYLKTLGVKTIEEAENMGQMLSLKGDYPFVLKDGNNKTNVGDKAFLDGYVILTKDQIDAEMASNGYITEVGFQGIYDEIKKDDWEDLFLKENGGNGMVEPYPITRDGVQQYKIPIKKPIQISQIANQNYNSSFYGATVTGKQSQHHAETFNEWQAQGINARRDKIYGQSYTSNPTGFKNNITANISSNKEIAPETKGELFKVIEELKNNPRATKETWVNFKTALETDGPEAFLEKLRGGNVQTTPPGKSTGGWSQTPATPRK